MSKFTVRIITWFYWIVGSRVQVDQICEDLKTKADIMDEFFTVLGVWNSTKFDSPKIRTLSINRLQAIGIRALELILKKKVALSSVQGDTYIENMKEMVRSYLGENLNFYEGAIVTNGTVEESIVTCKDPEIDQLFCLDQYLLKVLKEKEGLIN